MHSGASSHHRAHVDGQSAAYGSHCVGLKSGIKLRASVSAKTWILIHRYTWEQDSCHGSLLRRGKAVVSAREYPAFPCGP